MILLFLFFWGGGKRKHRHLLSTSGQSFLFQSELLQCGLYDVVPGALGNLI